MRCLFDCGLLGLGISILSLDIMLIFKKIEFGEGDDYRNLHFCVSDTTRLDLEIKDDSYVRL